MSGGVLRDHGHISADQGRVVGVCDADNSEQQARHAKSIGRAEFQLEPLRHPARKALVTKNRKARKKSENDAGETANVNCAPLDQERIIINRNETECWSTKNNRTLTDGGNKLGPARLAWIERKGASSSRTPPNLLCISHVISSTTLWGLGYA